MKRSFHPILLIASIASIHFSAYAQSSTVLNDPRSVAPFRVCFSDENGGTWPANYVKADQPRPFCFNQNLTLDEYKNFTMVEKDVFVATAMWQSYFKSKNSVHIKLISDVSRSRSGGEAMPGETLALSGPMDDTPVKVVEPSALTTLIGHQNDFLSARERIDIKIDLHPHDTQAEGAAYCYDPMPTSSTWHCQPNRKVRDLTSVILHELGHGYGIRSLRMRNEKNYGNFFNNKISAFDYQTNRDDRYHDLLANYADHFAQAQNPLVFTGASTKAYLVSQHQSPYLPLCNLASGDRNFSQNFSHFCYGSCEHPILMSGNWCLWKNSQPYRLVISDLELHILYDIGYAPVLKTTTAVDDLRSVLFNPQANQ